MFARAVLFFVDDIIEEPEEKNVLNLETQADDKDVVPFYCPNDQNSCTEDISSLGTLNEVSGSQLLMQSKFNSDVSELLIEEGFYIEFKPRIQFENIESQSPNNYESSKDSEEQKDNKIANKENCSSSSSLCFKSYKVFSLVCFSRIHAMLLYLNLIRIQGLKSKTIKKG